VHQFPHEKFNFKEIFDCVVCFQNMGCQFESYKMAKSFLNNVNSSLKKGNFFIGMMLDSASIWLKVQKFGKETELNELEIDKKLFKLTLPKDFERKDSYFGIPLKLSVLGENSPTEEYFIHCQTFLKVCEECGFEVLSITNLNEFYEDHKIPYNEALEAFRVFDGKQHRKIESLQKELVELYSVFVLKKY
jgi:mRNA (guanine-N7-)-methyltransferase